MGPIIKFAIPSTLEVSQDETIVLFTTRTMIGKGFTGITVKDRTWVTYLSPPYLYCILLSPKEHQKDFGEPMEQVLSNFNHDGKIDQAKLLELYNAIVSKTNDQIRKTLCSEPEVQELLEELQRSQEPLRPAWSLKYGYRYPLAEEIMGKSTEDTNGLLTTMMSAGLIHGRICGNIITCPKCRSHQVLLHAYCPKCGLPTLESGIALEHFVCNHTAFIEAFSSSSGLVCPQCKISLSPGTYRTLGKVFHCITCQSHPKHPDYILGCVDCKDTFTPDQAKYTPIYCYTAKNQ